jgi:capsular exopolysaccharide synthesis family protein
MDNTNNNSTVQEESSSFKDYLDLIRNHILSVVLITVLCTAAAILYAVNANDIFRSTTTIKLSKPQGSILESPLMPEFQDFGSDRFIANEIEILKSYRVRDNVAGVLIDAFEEHKNKSDFYMLLSEPGFNQNSTEVMEKPDLAQTLSKRVSIEQKRGLDIVEISVESQSPYEAALVANIYAQEYRNLNLEINRNQLISVKNFLNEQREEKQSELKKSEEDLRTFQEAGGIVALDEQASALIEQLSQFEAQMNIARLELTASTKILSQYKEELEKQSPRLAGYLENLSSEAYFKSLQEQLAKLQVNKDITQAEKDPRINTSDQIRKYDERIAEIEEKLKEKSDLIKAGIFASSPEQVQQLTVKILDEDTKSQALKIKIRELENIVRKYDVKFNQLPKSSIEFARLQRNRESLEKLYLLVEEKYQEALINEQSQPGNVLIIDSARIPQNPSKPNRMLIVIVGFIMGLGMAVVYVFVRNYFDDTVKTPEEIQKKNIAVLGWIPKIEGVNGSGESEFVVLNKPDSIPSEAFRGIRTRIHYSRLDTRIKSILVTSCAPQEGKTTIAVNLGGSFASANKKTLIIDCDLRKPRVHSVFKEARIPGLIDYLFGMAKLEEIIKPSEMKNLFYIPTGTIPPNPAEMLDSIQMEEFLNKMKESFDMILLDSPPIIAVTDAEILARKADATLLVISADTTEVELMEKSVELLKNDEINFIGTILNNFTYKSGYGSYYKYYYYYSKPTNGSETQKSKEKYLKDKSNKVS